MSDGMPDVEPGEMSDEELAEIEARCGRASPGPWTSVVEGRDQLAGSSFIMTAPPRGEDIDLAVATADEQDFVAHARQDVPRLVAELRRPASSGEGMTDRELEEIEARCGRVPPGPWRVVEGSGPFAGRSFLSLGPPRTGGGRVEVRGATPDDREFIARAREDVPRLVAEVRRRRALGGPKRGEP